MVKLSTQHNKAMRAEEAKAHERVDPDPEKFKNMLRLSTALDAR